MWRFQRFSLDCRDEMTDMKQFTKAVIRVVHGVVEVLFHFLFKLVYGGPGEQMPPIKDLLLLESASSIARKIRTRKVSFSLLPILPAGQRSGFRTKSGWKFMGLFLRLFVWRWGNFTGGLPDFGTQVGW